MKSIYQFLIEYSDKVKKQLKDKYKLENDNLTDTIIDYYIAQFERYQKSPKIVNKDITKYSFSELEKLIDSIAVVDKSNIVKSDTDDIKPIYNKDNIIVYEAPDKNSCIKLGKGEKWCISRNDTSNMYNTYRYRMNEPNFYFIKNLNKPESDRFSYYVLMVFNNNKYSLASRDNSGEFTGYKEFNWDKIVEEVPELANLQSLFKYKPLTEQERADYNKVKNEVSVDNLLKYFNSLSLVEQYIGMGHILTEEQLINLSKDLQNKYINTGNMLCSLDNLTQSQIDRYFTVNMQLNNGELDLSYLTSLPDNIKFPDEIGGNLKLYNLTSLPNNIKFPNEIGGDLDLFSLTSLPNNVKFPNKINGSLYLSNLTSLHNNVKFPEVIGLYIYLDKLTEIPQSVLDKMSEQVKSRVQPQSLIKK